MKKATKSWSATIVTALGALSVLTGCSNQRPTPVAKAESRLAGVAVVVAQKVNVPDWLEAVGTVRASQTSQVASQMMGSIVEIRVHEGDRVQGGQVLASIDDSQPRAAVEQRMAAITAAQKEIAAAETEFALADSTFKRYQQLYEKKSVSPQEFDEIKARRTSAEAQCEIARAGQTQADAALTQARNALGYTRIHAPFGGLITERKADLGTMAVPGSPLFTIEDTRRYRLEATVDERDLTFVHIGETASVALDAFADTWFQGKIAQIVPAADPASRAFLVKIELPVESRLRSGLFGRARISRGERTALLIPRSALVERGQLQGVYLVDSQGEISLSYITVGQPSGQQVEVLSGLREGERLVAAPGERELAGKQLAAMRQ